MTDITPYLTAEASKLFPGATIAVRFDDDNEATFITIDGVDYGCFAGSDDDAFTFVKNAIDWEAHMTAAPDFTIEFPADL